MMLTSVSVNLEVLPSTISSLRLEWRLEVEVADCISASVFRARRFSCSPGLCLLLYIMSCFTYLGTLMRMLSPTTLCCVPEIERHAVFCSPRVLCFYMASSVCQRKHSVASGRVEILGMKSARRGEMYISSRNGPIDRQINGICTVKKYLRQNPYSETINRLLLDIPSLLGHIVVSLWYYRVTQHVVHCQLNPP